jgi:catechol 2,3-dioxygenase-like lactoylglutathione lyase family enzyme
MIQGLDNVGLAARDLGRMLDFYTATLGFTAERGENDAWLTLGNLTIYLFVTHPRDNAHVVRTTDLYADPPGLDHLALRVASIEDASAELASKGVHFESDIVGEPGEFRYRGFADPEGNMLYLVERPA